MTKILAIMKSHGTGCLVLGIALALSTAANAQGWFQDFNRQSLWFHENAKRVLEGKEPHLPGPDVKPQITPPAPAANAPANQQFAHIYAQTPSGKCAALAIDTNPGSTVWGAATRSTHSC